MANDDYHRKSVVFAKSDPERMELYKWLRKLDHGEFSERTIAFWNEQMQKEREPKD